MSAISMDTFATQDKQQGNWRGGPRLKTYPQKLVQINTTGIECPMKMVCGILSCVVLCHEIDKSIGIELASKFVRAAGDRV